MTTALILNIVLVAFVVIGIVGMLAWSIATQDREGVTGQVRLARRRRTAPARSHARVVGRPAQNRA